MYKIRWALIAVPLAVLLAACGAPAAEEAVAPAEEEEAAPAEEEEFFEEYAEPAFEEAPYAGELAFDAPAPQGPPPDTMIFQDYGNSPFFDATVDNLSTFAVDVDTGSYTLTRSYLDDYFLPPPEAIRTEEFVNYFEQDYPLPDDETFYLHMEAAPTPFNGPSRYVMRVGVQGYDVPPEQRPDATLIFVVDVSGSMDREDRLEAVKDALYTLVEELRPSDEVGIVIYGSRGKVLLEPTPVRQSRNILRAIDRLKPGGSTNAEEGLWLAYDMASKHYRPNRINRIILCSDGVANVGATGPDQILETVRQQAREGISLTTVGFGLGNYNDLLMEQLADDGDGQYYYVDTPREATRIFVDELSGTLQTIAVDTKIQVEFNPRTVSFYRLLGYENRDVADRDFRNDAVDAGEIGAGHSVTALYEVVPTVGAEGAIAIARLRWLDPETRQPAEMSRTLGVQDITPSFEEASPRFQQDVAVAAFAEVLGQSGWSARNDLRDVWPVAVYVADQLPNDFDVQEFVNLVEVASDLQG